MFVLSLTIVNSVLQRFSNATRAAVRLKLQNETPKPFEDDAEEAAESDARYARGWDAQQRGGQDGCPWVGQARSDARPGYCFNIDMSTK